MKKYLVEIVLLVLFLSINTLAAGHTVYFLQNAAFELKTFQTPRIISFGCGTTARTENKALSAIFPQGFEYVGIENDPAKVLAYADTGIQVVDADGSDLNMLHSLGFANNSFDIAIARHPDFWTYGDAFRKIFRTTIPSLLKRDGILIVSVLNEKEQQFMVDKNAKEQHQNIDSLYMDIRYDLLKIVNPEQQDRDCFDKAEAAYRDKYTYYFRNRENNTISEARWFKIDFDHIKLLEKIFADLGGQVKHDAGVILGLLQETYVQRISEIYGRRPAEVVHDEVTQSVDQNKICICQKKTNLKKCSRCKKVSYCSKDCQLKDWTRHKISCVAQNK